MSKQIISLAEGTGKNPKVLRSDEDFERWYQEQYDFRMFSDQEVRDVLQDERPESYPCIPYIHRGSHEVTYFSIEFIEYWSARLAESPRTK
jgi:hypothetical protein